MPNKTVYLREAEVPIWESARELSGDKLSPIIVTALARYSNEQSSKQRGFERIEVAFLDSCEHHLPKRKAFYGRWIFGPDHPLVELEDEGHTEWRYCVAETAKGAVVVHLVIMESDGGSKLEKLLIYQSFEQAAANPEINYAIRQALQERGVPVEELDI
jgi:hypothetical protein